MRCAHGAGRNDAVLFVHAHRAAAPATTTALAEVADLAAALPPSRERRLETPGAGRGLPDALARRLAGAAALARLAARDGETVAYPVAVGAVRRRPRHRRWTPPLTAYLHAFAANLVSAACAWCRSARPTASASSPRWSRVIAAAAAATPPTATARRPAAACAFVADLAAMRHETQYTRLFRS